MTLTTDYPGLRWRLVDQLDDAGLLTDPAIRAAIAAVPRHLFAPAVYDVNANGQIGPVLHGDQPAEREAYLESVYSDDAIVTQIAPDGRPTSSSTQPGVMAVMLEALQLHPRMTVLEIGTGTGYNAALLSFIVDDDRVTTIDIDALLVADAARALHVAGFQPAVVAGDGLDGYPAQAPYDRIIATCSVRRVPAAWLRQTRPGGIVMANLSYGVVPLRVGQDGAGRGRFLQQVACFIEARPADGPPGVTVDEIVRICMEGNGETSAGRNHDVAAVIDPACELFWRLGEPGVYQCGLLPDDERIHCLVDADTRSWARVHERSGEVIVVQAGPRRLWDDIVHLCRQWNQAGRPSHDRLGLTVTADGHHTLWVDEPDGQYCWSLR